jgi:5-methylcytosine-specific restriction endonuclease McrBC GTP-binding regulatory subunit McrB
MKSYVEAWNNDGIPYFLVIEEINRGNCAEIFGDIFQLLDRDADYDVIPASEIITYLNEVLTNEDAPKDKLIMPKNLTIMATMNTSDQSLFPMDSAFKRRWDWEYVPIDYSDHEKNRSKDFLINIENGTNYSWLDFIKKVNTLIKLNMNLGMDKCVGNYFINPSDGKNISIDEFIHKIIFYLWNDVFKDEEGTSTIFSENTTYEDFFPIKSNGKDKVVSMLNKLDVSLVN